MDIKKPHYTRRKLSHEAVKSRFAPEVAPIAAHVKQQVKEVQVGYSKWKKSVYAATWLLFFVFSFISTTLGGYIEDQRYNLSKESSEIVGKVSPNLAAKLEYDTKEMSYVYNKDYAPAPGSKEAGGGKYQAKMALDDSKGITVTDPESKMDITMVPKFDTAPAKNMSGRIIYPVYGKNAQIVYSVKSNGLKEDIILNNFVGEELSFEYELKLPVGTEARLLDEGDIGIYGGDKSLFGNITYGSDKDQKLIEAARKKSPKTNLLFVIPAPIIKESGREDARASAKFELKGNDLKITARDLDKSKYPLSIDPTMIVTSADDLGTGTDEDGNITYDNGQIKRSTLTGGSVGTWSAQNTYGGILNPAVVINNGYLYRIGGTNGNDDSTVWYSQLNGDGTMGDFTRTSSFSGGRYLTSAVVNNGYLYVMGGFTGASFYNTVQVASINANGTLGAFASTTNLPGPRAGFYAVVSSGRIYITGGCSAKNSETVITGVTTVGDNNCSTFETSSYYITPNANGTLPGTWTPGTSLLPPAGNSQGSYAGMTFVRNNRMYVMGGQRSDLSVSNKVQYSVLDPTLGTMGAWTSTLDLYSSVWLAHVGVVDNRLYVAGGHNGGGGISNVKYSSFAADGGLVAWQDGTSMPEANYAGGYASTSTDIYAVGIAIANGAYLPAYNYHARPDAGGGISSWTKSAKLNPTQYIAGGSVVVNGRAYFVGGTSAMCRSTMSASISSTGVFSDWRQEVFQNGCFHNSPTVVTYNGYIYAYNGHMYETKVGYAKILANGVLGAWSYSTSMPEGREWGGGTVYNGYLYAMGGRARDVDGPGGALVYKLLDEVIYAKINANGTIGAWTPTTSMPNARYLTSATAANGYLYITAGCTDNPPTNPGSCQVSLSDTLYARINSDGTVGSWLTGPVLPTNMNEHSMSFANGHMYIISANTGQGANRTFYAPQYADGTLGAWQTGLSRPAGSQHGNTLLYNGYAYVIGGYGTYGVYSAKIDPPGSTHGWVNSGNTFIGARRYTSSVILNGYIYVMGGCNTSCSLATDYYGDTQFAKINSDGSLGIWTTTVPFTGARAAASATVHNGRIYLTGGLVVVAGLIVSQSDVQYAQPSATTGQIGSWSVASPFPTARSAHRAVAHNGFMYVMGGCTNTTCVNTITDVQIGTINASSGNIVSWTAGRSLMYGRVAFGATVVGDKLYIMGGDSSDGGHHKSEWAALAADGTIGTWNVLANMPSSMPYRESGINFYKGYFYLAGGCAAVATLCNVESAGVWRAALKSDNSLDSWVQTTSMSYANLIASGYLPTYNDRIYIAGGCTATTSDYTCTAVTANTHVGNINNGGSGKTTSFNTATGAALSGSSAAVVSNGVMYVHSAISLQYAHIGTDGNITSFTSAASLPDQKAGGAIAIYNGYLYVTGGQNGVGSATTTTFYIDVKLDGSLGSTWQTAATPFSQPRVLHETVVYGGKIYVAGGQNGGSPYAEVEYADILSNGNLGVWSTTSSMNGGRTNFGFAAVADYLYAFGRGTTESAKINTNGTLQPWKYVGADMTDLHDGAAMVANGYLYYFGGYPVAGGQAQNVTTYQYAPILANGYLGQWLTESGMPTNKSGMGAAYHNGRAYLVAGFFPSSGGSSDVYYAGVQSIPRSANYSKMFNTDVDTVASHYLVNGTSSSNSGARVAYRSAYKCSDNSTGIATTPLASGACAAGSTSSGLFGNPTYTARPIGKSAMFERREARYHLLRFTLDDSDSGIFPDVSGSFTTIQDFTMYYTANPGKHLRGGKTFTSEQPRTLRTIPAN